MKKRTLQNTLVITTAIGAAVAAVYANTSWLSSSPSMQSETERCFGVVKTGKNDCANAKLSCATQSTKDSDLDEWIAVPKGLCERLVGGKLG